jgi:DNA-directed RNA polymerase subunit M/transcription elongation factor TFIIS
MYYLKLNDDKNLINFCKYCGHEDENILNTQNLKVLKYSKESKNNDIHINQYTKYDPTLPHMTTIKCPNVNCVSNLDEKIEQDIVSIRYDDNNMKYMYCCCHCDYSWTP